MLLSKKVFITSASLLLVVLLFWGIYVFSFKKPSEENPSSSIKNIFTENPLNENKLNKEVIQVISDEAVIAPTLFNNDDSIKYYSKTTGKVYQIDLLDLNKKTISETNIAGLIDVAWSPDQTMVISKFSTGTGYPKFSFFDYATKKYHPFGENIGSIVWQGNKKIIYTYFDNKNKEKSINIADINGENWQKITLFSNNNTVIAPIPKSGFISFWNKPDSFTESIMQSTPIIKGETKILSSGIFGADYLWNSDGTLFLRSNVDQKGGHQMELGFSNNLGGEYKNIGLPTFVSKCAWSKSNDYIFCALPGAISEKSILPNDYINNTFTTQDTFWKVNLKTGEKTRAVPLDSITTAYDATNMFLNSNESRLFFINKIDGRLYQISL